jgi:glyoxylase-like metal-dependent hydrolase (beta-lactamase superfamily II)
MVAIRVRWRWATLWAFALFAFSLFAASASAAPILQDSDLESLKVAVSWPKADVAAIVALTGRFIAENRDAEAYTYFQERAKAEPNQPIFLALEGVFQARTANTVWLLRRVSWVEDAIAKLDRAVAQDPGLSRYLRGVVLAELPKRFAKGETAIADLDWVLENRDKFPSGLRRSVYRELAKVQATMGHEKESREALQRSRYASLEDGQPQFLTDGWLTAKDGYHFHEARMLQVAPGVFSAQGYDFSDIGFVVTSAGIVAIDAGTTPAHAQAARAALGAARTQRISTVFLTHAHWDHIGGLDALRDPGATIVAQAGFAQELAKVNETGVPFRYFFGGAEPTQFHVVPDKLVSKPESLTIGGVEFRLYPIRGGETNDGMLIYLPASGVLFVGDAFMPYLGAPFLPEGSPEGLLDTIALIRSLNPKVLIHGHVPLTDLFTVRALPGFEAALGELHSRVLQSIKEGKPLANQLAADMLPASLRDHPAAVMPYLVMRNNYIQRMYEQHTGYWKSDGEGVETIGPRQWAALLNILADGKESEFVRTAKILLAQSDYVLTLKLTDLGLVTYPQSSDLPVLRRQALDGLRATNQVMNPFKFIIYSEWEQAELPPAE